ncbi:MAG: sporulation protein SpoOM [Verrucomicrobiae bacterium]|nr:sporulation protein SpoOM [Verrucomicrobiae bacterium]
MWRLSLTLFLTTIIHLHALADYSAIASDSPPETTPIFPLEDIRPGLTGTTYTVLQGTEIVPIQTTILGTAYNMLGPGLHLIIAKLTDEKTALTGAVHGMSGSPLYIEGKLAGALSRRITLFEKDGHCGFTPIQDMLTVNQMMPPHNTSLSPSPTTLHFTKLYPHLTTTHPPKQKTKFLPISHTRPPHSLHFLSQQIQPLAIPLTYTGLSPRSAELLLSRFPLPIADGNFIPIPAAASRPHPSSPSNPLSDPSLLKPGSPVSALLMTGDIQIGGTGTLTWRESNRILGFGHPMFAFGETEFPMANAEIISTIPSYFLPYKLSNIGPPLGTILQDRLSAIAGLIGPSPHLATYTIHREHNHKPLPTLSGQFINHPLITPTLLAFAFAAALEGSDQTSSRILTADITASLHLENLPTLDLSLFHSGQDFEIFDAIIQQLLPLLTLYRQDITPVKATRLDLHVHTSEKQHIWTIEKASTDFNLYPRQAPIRLSVTLRERLTNSTHTHTLILPIPENIRPGTQLTLRIAGARELDALDTPPRLNSTTHLPSIIHTLNSRRRTNALYAQILTPTIGQILDTRPMPSLPPSILKLLERSTTSTRAQPLPHHIWTETSLPLPALIQGLIDLTIQVDRPTQSP